MSDVQLGQLLPSTAVRDAIHVAIAPVVAACELTPGQDAGMNTDGMADSQATPIGIVDPFLSRNVRRGQRFYLLLYPNTVTGMRHHWLHPSFDLPSAIERSASETWLRDFAERIGLTFPDLLDAITRWVERQEYHVFQGHKTPEECYTQREEMWRHYEAYTGKPVPPEIEKDYGIFSCSC